MTHRFLLLSTLLVLLPGCGADHVNEDEASTGWRTASQPLLEGQQAMQKKAEENRGKLAAGETLTHVVDCETAGDVKFELSVELNPEGDQEGPKVDFTANYRDCEANRITSEGELAISSPEFSPDSSNDDSDSCDCPEPTPVDYEGFLEYTGKVDGPCSIDLTATIPPWGRPTYSGNLCGYDAGEQLNTAF